MILGVAWIAEEDGLFQIIQAFNKTADSNRMENNLCGVVFVQLLQL